MALFGRKKTAAGGESPDGRVSLGNVGSPVPASGADPLGSVTARELELCGVEFCRYVLTSPFPSEADQYGYRFSSRFMGVAEQAPERFCSRLREVSGLNGWAVVGAHSLLVECFDDFPSNADADAILKAACDFLRTSGMPRDHMNVKVLAWLRDQGNSEWAPVASAPGLRWP